MLHQSVHAWVAVLAGLAFAAGASGQAAKTEPAAEEVVLREKGLIRSGTLWLLEADLRSQEEMRSLAKLRVEVEQTAKRRSAIEVDIRQAEASMGQWEQEYRALNERISKSDRGVEHNKLVGQINSLGSKLREGQRYKEQKQKDLRALRDGRDQYVEKLRRTAEVMEAAVARYEELTADADVTRALARLGETNKVKPRLGPTPAFAQRLAMVRKERAGIETGVIKVEFEGGVPCVNVTLNGTLTRKMVVDSGAATVLLTHATARALGMNPGKNDPAVEMVVASGKRVTCRIMRLKSVGVAEFEVGDVECAVLPRELGEGAGMLLGGSFLRNFVYRMNLEAGELHLTQVAGKPDDETPAPPAGLTRARPATAPATSPVAAASSDAGKGELLSSMRGDVTRKDSGVIVLTGSQRVSTDRWYTPPVVFKVVAMTDSTNVRFRYGVKQVIFNWELNPDELRVQGGPVGERHKGGAGKVPTNQWVEFELAVQPDGMTIAVDGEERHRIDADFSDVTEPLTIFTHNATVRIKSVTAVENPSK